MTFGVIDPRTEFEFLDTDTLRLRVRSAEQIAADESAKAGVFYARHNAGESPIVNCDGDYLAMAIRCDRWAHARREYAALHRAEIERRGETV